MAEEGDWPTNDTIYSERYVQVAKAKNYLWLKITISCIAVLSHGQMDNKEIQLTEIYCNH